MVETLSEAEEYLERFVKDSMADDQFFVDHDFQKQKDFILCDDKRIAALCTRRAGKSFGVGLKMFRAAMKHPMSSILYLALTRGAAKRIMWKDVIKSINSKFLTDVKFNEAELTVTFKNGSVIYLAGADSTKDEMEKILGGKLSLVVVDEAGSFRQDLRKLCYEMIEPALADYDGSLVMIGTPTDLLDSLFHVVTRGDDPSWTVFKWNTFDNPYMASNWQKRVRQMKEENPGVEDTPFYRRMYLGEWVTDLSSLVYKFDETKNFVRKAPDDEEYIYVMGVDLGFDDPSAFVIGAYSRYDNLLYFVDAYKSSKMIISDVAERIKYYQNLYPIFTIVVDNAAKQSVEELKQRFNLSLTPADKAGKAEFIEIMNSEMIQGRIKVTEASLAIANEWKSLIWDERSTKRQEHPNCENHLSDAALYCWRHCLTYITEKKEHKPTTEEEKVDLWFEEQAEKVEQRKNMPFWEDGIL